MSITRQLHSPFRFAADSYEGGVGKVAGWGTLYENGRPSCVLRHVDVPIVGHAQCADTSYVGGLVTEDMVCAGHETGGKDSCQGDSGGPLMRLVPGAGGGGDKRFEIIGNGARAKHRPEIAPGIAPGMAPG